MKMKFINITIILITILFNSCSTTIVKNLLRSRSCNKDPGLMTIDEKRIIISTHNHLRNQIAMATNSIGPRLPYATNMVQMYYSDAIGAKAQQHADKCTFIHSDRKFRKQPQFETGENIYKSTFYMGRPEKNWQKVIETWFSEIKDFKGKSVVSFNPNGASTGHFTQIIWANSYFVGCGFASYSGFPLQRTHLYVCQYGPVGNIKGFPIYKAKTERQCDCPSELSCNNLTFPGLCCPSGHCNHNSIEFSGEAFKGTLPNL